MKENAGNIVWLCAEERISEEEAEMLTAQAKLSVSAYIPDAFRTPLAGATVTSGSLITQLDGVARKQVTFV